jgi:zinc protease
MPGNPDWLTGQSSESKLDCDKFAHPDTEPDFRSPVDPGSLSSLILQLRAMISLITCKKLVAIPVFFIVVLIAAGSVSSVAQVSIEPRREQTLNGLRVLILQRPADPNVTLKLRIHSGSAFDLSGKAGTMSVLMGTLFPDPTTREYVADELGGKLDMSATYDSLDITMVGKPADFERLVELLRTALVSTQVTAEGLAAVKALKEKALLEAGASTGNQADAAIARRLFGDFPYGRPVEGTPESLAAIDRADLLLARQRFVNPNNSTLVVAGNIQTPRAMRALRQMLGGWRKSDTVVPATFREAAPADQRVLVIPSPDKGAVELRLAVRGLARSDKDTASAEVLIGVLKRRWASEAAATGASDLFVRNKAYLLPGIFVLGGKVPSGSLSATIAAARKSIDSLSKSVSSATELESVKAEIVATLRSRGESTESMAEIWLDNESYKAGSIDTQVSAINRVNATDLQRVANRLFKGAALAVVAAGNTEEITRSLEGTERLERLPPPDSRKADAASAPAKP